MCQLWVWPSGSSTHRRERSIVIGAWKQISHPSKLTWKILILHITTCMNHIFFPGLVRLNTIFQSYYAAMVSDTCQGLRVSPSLPSHEQAISLPLWWKVRSVCVRSWFFFCFPSWLSSSAREPDKQKSWHILSNGNMCDENCLFEFRFWMTSNCSHFLVSPIQIEWLARICT